MSQWPRPCPIPGHPHEEDAPVVVTGTAWARVKRWHLQAPAERLPLPVIVFTWPVTWVLHVLHVPGHVFAYATAVLAVLTWLARIWHRESPHPRVSATEAAVAVAVIGSWVTAAITWGPLGWSAHLLSWVYVAGAAGGYWWLRRHEAVRAARQRRDDLAAELADKREWHQILPRIGLGGWHMQDRWKTNLGEERLVTTSPENALASRVAASSGGIAEKLAHIRGLPYGRIDVTTTDYPGQLIISIRTVDVSVRDAAYHPMTMPWPEPEPSPFADWFGETASIRDRMIWGFSPEDGSALDLTLFSEIGGRAVGVMGATGSGKSNVLNGAREFITRCTDARMVQLNGAHMGDELTWEPLSALTICGPVATDEDVRNRIAAALAALCLLVTNRSATLAETGHSTFQPTPDDPAVGIIIDEVDEIVAHVPGAGKALDFLASKQRKSAVFLLLATQRAVISSLGGGGVRANMAEVLIGMVNRATESRHATGAEKEIPDIREYAKGAPGYFQRFDPHSGTVTGRGRAFLLGKPPDELAYMKRLVAARRPLRDWSIPDLPPLELDEAGDGQEATTAGGSPEVTGLRARLASIAQTAAQAVSPRPAPKAPAAPPDGLPVVPGVPQAVISVLYPMLAAGRVSAAEAGMALGVSKTVAYEYLATMRTFGHAEVTGGGRSSGWQLPARLEVPEGKRAEAARHIEAQEEIRRYQTLEDLARAAHDGLVDVDEDLAQVLEEVYRITGRQRLTVVPSPPGDDGESRC